MSGLGSKSGRLRLGLDAIVELKNTVKCFYKVTISRIMAKVCIADFCLVSTKLIFHVEIYDKISLTVRSLQRTCTYNNCKYIVPLV